MENLLQSTGNEKLRIPQIPSRSVPNTPSENTKEIKCHKTKQLQKE